METPPRMTARHAVPAPTPEIELSPYPTAEGFQSASHPLLPQPGGSSRHNGGLGFEYSDESDTTILHRPGKRYSKNPLRRYWKPLLFISLPFVLVFLYSVVHPHVPGLPALPKVKVHIDHGDETALSAGEGGGKCGENDCICGSTDEGKRLCEVYRPEGLVKSQLIRGSGARVRRVLQKARDGERIKVGILGGSGQLKSCLFQGSEGR